MKQWQHSIVTGAGSGIGLGLAQRLLRRGGRVSVINRSLKDEARALLDEAANEGASQWQYLQADVSDEAALHTVVEAAVQSYGSPDLAINSAGIAVSKTFANTPGSEFEHVINVNLNGSAYFAAAVLPYMQPGSRLALIASMAGLVSNYGYSAYGASKFGVVGLATSLRYEYEPLGIGITCVCPPEVHTPMIVAERKPENNPDPVCLGLKDIVGTLDVDYACDSILKGIDRGRWMVISGFMARSTALTARILPAAFFAFMRFSIYRLRRKYAVSG
ncbi:MAG: SDR family NAD(P)-dependent oxidoreductase [Salinisphaeraceae bacterium]|nr:SDR family NAD(P)-dependent oxidoreductase [Salinisphaeraceae bacterium]